MTSFTEAERRRIDMFRADHAEGLRGILLAAGREDPGHDPATVCLAFANYRLRRIPAKARRVHRSDVLRKRKDLAPEEPDAIDRIDAKLRAGIDLYPHQSTSIRNPLAKDGLLADWLLLARITDTDAYLIDCLPHGPGVDPPWWHIDLPETIHRNWPETIAHLAVEGYEPKL